MLLIVVVHIASILDRNGAKEVFRKAKLSFSRLQLILADSGYAGKLVEWVKESRQWFLEIVKRNEGVKGFQEIPRH